MRWLLLQHNKWHHIFAFSLILQSLRRFTSMKKNFLLFVISKNAFRVAQSSDETIAKR